MKHIPDLDQFVELVIKLIDEKIEPSEPVKTGVPLMRELGMDSLDLIELSFALQEFFEFEFSDKNAVEELEKALANRTIIAEGVITPLGIEMARQRMPELADIELPERITPVELQQFYTVETFARLIREFFTAAPETCPETGEAVVVRDFHIVTETSNKPVAVPSGDELIDAWVAATAKTLQKPVP